MILFINFAPINYLGGAERKLYELFKEVSKKEKAVILTADKYISGLYGKIVLGQAFEDRSNGELNFSATNYTNIGLNSLLPFTAEARKVRNVLKSSRIIYIKGDIQEFIILYYFGGKEALSKTIAGIRSAWLYPSPENIFDHLHNFLYSSALLRYFLKNSRKIHTLSLRDTIFFKDKMRFEHVVHVSNYSEIIGSKFIKQIKRDKRNLEVVFVGELTRRKGVDRLFETIRISPTNFKFHIVGKGAMHPFVERESSLIDNVEYHGYMDRKSLFELLNKCDVLFFPSKAEGFGGVVTEAASMGLKVVDSPEVYLGLPKYIEYSPKESDPFKYLELLNKMYLFKIRNKQKRSYIRKYALNNFSSDKILKETADKLIFS